MFALIAKDRISLKCEPFTAELLRKQFQSVTPGYHLNKQHWNTVIIDGTVPDDEIRWMINHSYDLVFKSLTKAEKEQILEG
jgi:predicted DNA-binding protein (MmcQ/YjbR family)